MEIFEYQVIVDQVEPEREMPWVDGGTRRPGASYEFEILAIEVNGNSTISVGEFDTSD